jgi:hypothetical protein
LDLEEDRNKLNKFKNKKSNSPLKSEFFWCGRKGGMGVRVI